MKRPYFLILIIIAFMLVACKNQKGEPQTLQQLESIHPIIRTITQNCLLHYNHDVKTAMMREILKGTKVHIVGEYSDYYKVTDEKNTGWVYTPYLTIPDDNKCYVLGSGVAYLAEPTIKSHIKGAFKAKTQVRILQTCPTWYEVEVMSTNKIVGGGWIYAKSIK